MTTTTRQQWASRLTALGVVLSLVSLVTITPLMLLRAGVGRNQPVADAIVFALVWGYLVVTPAAALAAIVCDGRLVAAVEEERFNRVK